MVVHKGHRVIRPLFDQGVFKNVSEIIFAAGLGRVKELVMKGDVKKGHLPVHLVQIVQKTPEVRIPVFAHSRQTGAQFPADILEQVFIKAEADVFDRVQTQAVNACLPDIPEQPLADLFGNLRVAHLDIHSHQVVKISFFRICVFCPVVSRKAIDQALVPVVLVVICPGKMPVVPYEITVFPMPAGKCKF